MIFPNEPPLTGDALKRAVEAQVEKRAVYAEGLLYENSAVMISADPGTGKSYLALQAAIQLATGLPLFGVLHVPKSIRVYYIQKERPSMEVFERLRTFADDIGIDWSNLTVDSALQFVNFSDPKNAEGIVSRILAFKPQLVIIDPIGAGLGGLSKDEIANNFCSVLTYVQNRVGNSFWLSHHTTKTSYDRDGIAVKKEKPFYGSQWLDAYVTGHYHVTKSTVGTDWRKTKDNYGVLLKNFKLEFDHDTGLSFMPVEGITVKDKVINYIKSVKGHKNEFKFNDLLAICGCTMNTLRYTLREPLIADMLEKCKSSGNATLYRIKT